MLVKHIGLVSQSKKVKPDDLMRGAAALQRGPPGQHVLPHARCVAPRHTSLRQRPTRASPCGHWLGGLGEGTRIVTTSACCEPVGVDQLTVSPVV